MTHFYAPMMPVQLQMDTQQTGSMKWKTAIVDSIRRTQKRVERMVFFSQQEF